MSKRDIYIVMNRHIIAANRKAEVGDRQPPVRVTRGKSGKPVYCETVEINGFTEILNGRGEPVMPCGATVAIRVRGQVSLLNGGTQIAYFDNR